MAPILGIWASSKAVAAADTGAMFPLQVVTVGAAGTSTVEFTNIPSTYNHLQVRTFVKSAESGSSFGTVEMKINGNSLTKMHYLYANGSSVLAGVGSSNVVLNVPTAGYTSIFGAGIIDILDYKDTNKNKTVRILDGVDTNGAGEIVFQSNLYATNTNAITSLTFTISGGHNFAQYSQFALYAVKGA